MGDHGCEYMTGGKVVVIGPTGRNFAAGMSGGVAYILDEAGHFIEKRCNHEMVDFDPFDEGEADALKATIEKHVAETDSAKGKQVLADWEGSLKKFVKIMPKDYKKAIAKMAAEAAEAEAVEA